MMIHNAINEEMYEAREKYGPGHEYEKLYDDMHATMRDFGSNESITLVPLNTKEM